jgi:hypothetical protein
LKQKHKKKTSEDVIDAETMSKAYIRSIVTDDESGEPIQFLEGSSTGHTTVLGSKRPAATIQEVVGKKEDQAFTSFRFRIANAVQAFGFTSSGTISDLHQVRHLDNLLRLHQSH